MFRKGKKISGFKGIGLPPPPVLMDNEHFQTIYLSAYADSMTWLFRMKVSMKVNMKVCHA